MSMFYRRQILGSIVSLFAGGTTGTRGEVSNLDKPRSPRQPSVGICRSSLCSKGND